MRIEKQQAWQNYVETHFNLTRKMADAKFAQARAWEEMLAILRSFVNDYNVQRQWVHEKRDDGCHSPAQVLSWHKGTMYPESVLNRILFATRYTRHLGRHGYIRFQDWRQNARARTGTPAGQRVGLVISTLKLEQQAVTLSRYHVEVHEDRRHIQAMSRPHVAETVFRSPQLTLFDLGPDECLLYWKASAYAPRRRHAPLSHVTQLILFEVPVEAKATGAETAPAPLRLVRAPQEHKRE